MPKLLSMRTLMLGAVLAIGSALSFADAAPLPLPEIRQPEVDITAKARLEHCIQAYQGLRTLRFGWTNTVSGDRSQVVTQGEAVFERPNRFRVQDDTGALLSISDGERLWWRAKANETTFASQKWEAQNSMHAVLSPVRPGPGLLFPLLLQGRNPVDEESSVELLSAKSRGDEVQLSWLWMYGKAPLQTNLEFDDESGLIRREVSHGEDRLGKFQIVTTYSNVVLDQDPPAGAFTFTAPEGTKVMQITGVQSEVLRLGEAPPALVGTDRQGKPIDLKQFQGNVVLVDFWATWCGPCIEEFPALKDVYRKYRGHGVEIIGISADENVNALDDYLVKEGLPWRNVYDAPPGAAGISKNWGVRSWPFTVVIDRDGKIAATNVRGAQIERSIRKALSAP